MKNCILILGFAASLSGCFSYPSSETAASSGIVVDESGSPVEGAIVCSVVYRHWPFPRLFAHDVTRTGTGGSFTTKATARIERTWSLFAPGATQESPFQACAACGPGTKITNFPCDVNARVTLSPIALQPTPDNAKKRNRPSGEFDVMENLLSECALTSQAK
jgi:hypothetical protein